MNVVPGDLLKVHPNKKYMNVYSVHANELSKNDAYYKISDLSMILFLVSIDLQNNEFFVITTNHVGWILNKSADGLS